MTEEREKKEITEDRIFNFRPACFAAAFLCLGIALGYQIKLNGASAWWSLLLLPVLGTPFFFCRTKRKRKRTAFSVLLLAVAYLIGLFSFLVSVGNFADCGAYNGEFAVVGRVVDITPRGETTELILDRVYVDGNRENGKLKAYLPASFCENIALADEVLTFGAVKTETVYANDYGFRANDIGENIRFKLSGAEYCVVTDHGFDLFLAVRSRMQRVVYTGMDETSSAVTMAVLTGNTSGIESGLLDNMRAGGIAHIFAVSGLHVGALYAFCLFLFRKTPLKKLPALARFIMLGALLLFYGGVCGFSASVIRASVLCLITYAAKLIGLKTDMLDTLGVAAIIVLLITPTALFEVGFQLSFAACAGIAVWSRGIGQVCSEAYEKIEKRFFKERIKRRTTASGDPLPPSVGERIFRKAISLVSVSLAAQIATAPVLLSAFGYLSGWSLLLNFLFVPFISGVFAILLSLVFIACVLPVAIAPVLLYVSSVVWSAVLLLFEIVDFSAFSLVGLRLTGGAKGLYYMTCLAASDKLNISRKMRAIFFIGCLTAFVVAVL